jgi:hypothetical protein
MSQPQYQEYQELQEYQQIQQVEQPLAYTDTTTSTYQPDQSIQQQVNPSSSDTSTGAPESFTGVQSDMYRRTGGQGRNNPPGQPVQQMPIQQPGMPQPLQDPQAVQQAMPQQQMMQQSGMPGMCTIQVSEDRSSIALFDGSGQEINHVALGRDRVQKIFKSPDGNWNVLVFKVRQRQEYGAITVNMPQCDPQEAREIRAIPENIEFQGDTMQLRFPGNIMDTLSLTHKTGP